MASCEFLGGLARPVTASASRRVANRLERRDLFSVELPELARPNVLVRDRADAHAPQAVDRMADRLAHVPHLTVAAFLHHDRQQRVLRVRPLDHFQQLHVRGRVLRPSMTMPFASRSSSCSSGTPQHPHLVFALDLVAGMGQLRREIAVAGQQQQPFRFVIEPPDRIHVVAHAPLRQQIDHGRTALRIGSAGDVAARLVHQDVQAACAALTRRPSTRMSSVSGSALEPSAVTVSPLTETRPSVM